MRPHIAVLDYGSGNLRSACRALERVGAQVQLASTLTECSAANGLLVPGVGAFDACMQGIAAIDGKGIIKDFLSKDKPVLGICVGMQILFEEGIEHGVHSEGLGFLPGRVDKIQAEIVPHMGWNTVAFPENSRLFAGISPMDRVYFVHSYGVRLADHRIDAAEKLSSSRHGEDFIAAIEKDNLWATQFHPEKSGSVGLHLLSNWLQICAN